LLSLTVVVGSGGVAWTPGLVLAAALPVALLQLFD